MKDLNESLKQSLLNLEQFLPQVDHAMEIASQKIRQVDQFKLLWHASLKDLF